ncbi:MAG: hypothetical protein MK211_08315 [Flavobacteriales bacterium]|jgi:hypothetical protein|nr:hypothetical protein [Flavobacteriales bacterium]
MNWNYSYRAFLITSLLFGILFLVLYSIKLGNYEEAPLENYDVVYKAEELLLEEEELAIMTPEKTTVETNRAYNEAEEFINDAENLREDPTETIEGKLAEIDRAIAESNATNNEAGIEKAKEKIIETRERLSNGDESSNETVINRGANRRTTISYRLVGRTAIDLPNPVYTCEGGGKIVISIEVNALGKITRATYNKNLSTTTNGCLIESALEYANNARFTTNSAKDKQLGTITYNFPGQY